MTIDLYTTKEVKEVREKLTLEQDNMDLLTGLEIEAKQHCLDHNHQTMFVRGVLSRQVNAALGKIEGIKTRYLKNYPGTLADFLRQAALYLEAPDDTRYHHPHWLKKVKTEFNKLKPAEKNKVLLTMGEKSYTNDTKRKEAFGNLILTRNFTYDKIIDIIHKSKEGQ